MDMIRLTVLEFLTESIALNERDCFQIVLGDSTDVKERRDHYIIDNLITHVKTR